ncbi:MAG: 16S rRNA (adenine(1518)-N(6)/adenine(1519)-N(6))-dimethyltransferase RsmA [Acidimicrobiales bacterium]|nr:16S rRNA (adenine(1518)-N(6)/adenine(1519)-N(6))-dimethyltransferase RsmA [Acidimicrobiales bacterium]MCB9393246.1 16S rRNA (adenine(1518)-N(6)/adenine(1519)-N(6))-dimethyltransferase RsmA [Acidimicrobiaceae bacterium]
MLSRADVQRLLAEHGLAARRDLGQNFVGDPNTVRRIARLAGVGPGDHVVEIGPGLGSLTLALAETGATVVAVEVDRGIVPVLRDVVRDCPNVTVVEGDAMRLEWTEVLAGADHWVLVANLPYNVATPLVADLLDGVPAVERMLVMVQREVAERFCASPRTPAYGAVTVKIAHWSTARIAGLIPASVFVPRPNVESALAEITRRSTPATTADPASLFHLVRTAFGQRRKMLRRSLAGVVAPEVFEAAGIDSQRRPEELDVVEWGHLAQTWDDRRR